MINIADYRSGEFPFPKHEIDPKEKGKPWLLAFCQAIFSAWVRDKTALPYSTLDQFNHLRALGAGKQDPEIYQDILIGEAEDYEDHAEREGWLNVNWEIFSPAPKFKNVVVGMMESQDHDVMCTAVDPTSGKEREEKKWLLWMESQYKNKLDRIDSNLGVRKDQEAFLPNSIQELQIYEELGGFKLKKEYSMERGIDYTLYISDWKEIRRKLYNDFLDINIGATKDYVDKATHKVRCRYVNPSRLIIQYSKHANHKNSEWAGEIIPMKIVDIRAQNPDITEEELQDIAYQYQAVNRNPTISNWAGDDLRREDGSYKYDDFWIDVLDAEIKSVDIAYKQKRRNDRGQEFYFQEEFGKIKNTDKRQTTVVRGQTVYRAKWIVGTKHIFDYGHQFDIPRPGKKAVALSYHVYKLPGRSFIDLIEQNLHQIQLTYLKMQNAIAMAAPTGIAVEFSSLQNMAIKGGEMEPLDILEIRRGTGDMVYRATTHRGYVNSPHAGKPIQEIEGGLGRSLEEFVQIFELNFQFIRDLTGINEIADATTPNPNQPVGTSKLAMAATNNSLKPMYSGYIHLLENTSRNVALRLQILVKHSKKAYEVYYPVVGKATLETLSIGTEILDADMYIKVEARPDREEVQELLAAARDATKADQDGFVGLEYGDYLMVARLARTGNVRLAEAVMAYRSKQNKQIQQQLQNENMQLNAKNEQETQAQKHGQKIQEMQAENELKKDFETHKAEQEIRVKEEEHQNKMEEIAAEKMADAAMAAATSEESNSDQNTNQNQ